MQKLTFWTLALHFSLITHLKPRDRVGPSPGEYKKSHQLNSILSATSKNKCLLKSLLLACYALGAKNRFSYVFGPKSQNDSFLANQRVHINLSYLNFSPTLAFNSISSGQKLQKMLIHFFRLGNSRPLQVVYLVL
jgi:hypothetical protein